MDNRQPRVLLIDDDEPFCQLLVEYLGTEGLHSLSVHTGGAGLQACRGGEIDLVVLDIMLPDINGLDVLRQVRQEREDLPVLMLTARGDDLDRILGLELGADDYLAKPCNPRELTARVHAILRRTRRNRAAVSDANAAVKESLLTISAQQRVARWRGEVLNLTSSEFNILALLHANQGEAVPKLELSDRALGRILERYDRSLDVHVSNLRRKLGNLDDGRSPIQTVYGAGYLLLSC
ncbi:MAG: response regulator transcription factor [Rhodocyclaceae bacterium]|nr:response regulator transcription factor [Rhodocyclaceae bacterium]MDZ4215530.1 response regulator transcription factor [Rhodocyclaceae bacterium]